MGKELKRMRYFDGLFLNKDDYKLDQEYQMRLQQLHSRYLHTWGIVAGLEVKALEDSCTVEVTEGLALNQVTNDENAESISQQICIYEGHPDSIINLSQYPANENIFIFVSYEETLEDKDNLEKGKGQEIHILERGRISHSKDKPSDEKKYIILARVVLKIVEGQKFINEISYNQTDGKTSLRTYAGPAGKVLALEKIIFKMKDDADITGMPFIKGLDQGAKGIGLEVDSFLTNFTGSVNVKGDLIVNGSIENSSSAQNELLVSNCFVQVNSKPEEETESEYGDEPELEHDSNKTEEEPWSPRDGGLQVYRGESEAMPDASIMWSENDKKWKIGYKYKEGDIEKDKDFFDIAYGPIWEMLINSSIVDDLHKHTKLCYANDEVAMEALEADNSRYLSINGDLSLNDKTMWFRSKDNTSHGLGWFGFGKPFAGVAVDGPVLFGLKGGVLGTTAGEEKAVITWNSLGNVGIGVQNPIDDRLELAGSLRILSATNPLKFTSNWTGFPDSKAYPNRAEISNDTNNHKALMIVGNQSSGQGRKVAIWDRLDVNGMLYVNGNIQLSQALNPSSGKETNNGIIFPTDPGGGSGDAAWIRHYPRSGEACTLEIGTSNDGDDNISLMASGNVGIGTINPSDKLDVSGWTRIMSGSNPIRFTSAWSGFPDQANNQAEVCNDTTNFKSLMIAGNKSAGGRRKVSIWDNLDVNGSLKVNGDFKSNCAIVASAGSGDNNGISFPKDYYGGSGDAAWIRYYSDLRRGGGENMTLEIGISNDVGTGGYYGGGDRIRLFASGGVFVEGNFYYSSSRDYKENITALSTKKAKKILEGLNPVAFNFKGDTEKTTLGFIAEDVPQAVAANDQKAISPMDIVAVLTSVVKDQRKAISLLQQQVDSL